MMLTLERKGEEKAGKKRYGIDAKTFVLVWNSCNTIDEVVERLKMPKPIIHARAHNYRQQGIKLKQMPRKGRRGIDVEELNRLVEMIDSEKKGKEAVADTTGPLPPEDIQSVVNEVIKKLENQK